MTTLRGWFGSGIAVILWFTGGGGLQSACAQRTTDLPDRRPVPADDLTFRPTVIVRKGLSQGSGTVIASVEGETLILTAAHVIKDPGTIQVELHRYNLGRERDEARGRWPRVVAGEIAGADIAADLGIVRVRDLDPLPFVARLVSGDEEPGRGTVVVSVGIDKGTRLTSWQSRVRGVTWLSLENERGERPFLITVQPPEHGRSGGGLFLAGGELTGVCIGRAEIVQGRTSGVFASAASVRRLLRDHDLDGAVARSESRRAAAKGTPVTPTQARPQPRSTATPSS